MNSVLSFELSKSLPSCQLPVACIVLYLLSLHFHVLKFQGVVADQRPNDRWLLYGFMVLYSNIDIFNELVPTKEWVVSGAIAWEGSDEADQGLALQRGLIHL